MPEGDAVWRTARRLHDALAGRVLAVTDFRVPALATLDLRGRSTLEVVPRGKHLLHRVEGGVTVHSHLRMDGRWSTRARAAGDAVPTRHTLRAVLATERWWALGDRLGMLDAVPTEREEAVVGHLGPDLLDPAFDTDDAVARVLRSPDTAIAEVLLDQRTLAGIGTIFASEPLFLHRAHPWAPVGSLDPGTVRAVVDTARELLVRSCRLGRTSTGPDAAPQDTWVFARVGLPCLRCGGVVRMAGLGLPPRARVLNYCPRCQGGLAPGDDGRPQRPLGA